MHIMLLFPLLFILSGIFSPAPQTVEVTITGIRAPQGQIVFGIYKNDETFAKETPFMQKNFKKVVSSGEMKLTMQLEPGLYGLTMLDDEDGDNKMQYNFFGLPKEGFGFSNYQSKGFTKPKFENFKFTVPATQGVKVTVPVRYIL